MSKYVTVKCPRCMSTSQLPAKSITREPFLCPVCSEGEVKPRARRRRIFGDKNKIRLAWEKPMIISSTLR